MNSFHGNQTEVYIAWVLLVSINSFSLFTNYYDALLLGKGLIKRSKQISIASQLIYLVLSAVLIMAGYGLVAIVSAQVISVLLVRFFSYRTFFSKELKNALKESITFFHKEVLKAVYPNSVKMGLTLLGGFLVTRSSMVISSLYLPLEEIASYGISFQIITVIATLSGIYISTYQPKIVQLRVNNDTAYIRELYLRGQIILVLTYLFSGIALVFMGEWALSLIGSKTHLMSPPLLAAMLALSLIESNHSMAALILLSKNEVPFFKASLVSGVIILVGLVLMFRLTSMKLFVLILVPFIVDMAYQSWKWPYEVIRELNISAKDYLSIPLFSHFPKNKKYV